MPSHAQKIGGIWHYRLAVPADLKPFFPCREIKHSTKCGTLAAARPLLASYDLQYQQLFAHLRFSAMAVSRISKQAIELWQRQNPGKQWQPPELRYNPAAPLQSYDITQLLLDYGFTPDASGKFDLSQPPANETLHFRHATAAPIATPAPPAENGPAAPVAPAAPHKHRPQRNSKQPLLSVVVDQFLADKSIATKHQKPIKPSTYSCYRDQLNKLMRYTGNIPIDLALSSERLDAYTTRDYEEGLRSNSINNGIRLIKTFAKWCISKQYISALPDVQTIVRTDEEELTKGNQNYTLEELQAIVDYLPNLTHKKLSARITLLEFKYIFLVCMYTGNRIKEILPTKKTDFDYINGHNVVSFVDVDTKNISSRRIVPLAKKLLNCHLLDFVSKQSDSVFGCTYTTYNKTLVSLLKKLNVKERPGDKAFHSLRHNVYTALNDLQCPAAIRDSITGHTQAGMGKIYDKVTPERLQTMSGYVNQLHEKINLVALRKHLKSELDYLYPATNKTQQ